MSTIVAEARRSVGDVSPLVSFRMAGLRARSRRVAWVALGLFSLLTVLAAFGPAYAQDAVSDEQLNEILLLLPTGYLAFLLTTSAAIISAAGGRELLPREQGVGFPISPTTDHLGALLLAPLNIAWIMQAWSLLGVTALVNGRQGIAAVQLTAVVWLVSATAIAQAVAWGVEWVRRGPHGVAIVRAGGLSMAAFVAWLVVTDSVASVLDQSPTVGVVISALEGGRGSSWGHWAYGTWTVALLGFAAVVVGAWIAHAVARRQARDETRAEGRVVSARQTPLSDFGALVRVDRASVWRSLPLRRGFLILAVLPGLVAAAGELSWDMLPVLPGLVAAGGALLFGVNAWCLDASGALWRDSLPVNPQLVFVARAWVLLEVLLVATALTLCVAGVRADALPSSAELASVIATGVVVSLQVVARSMHWSVHRPYATDLRSARGTPAPPLAMVGYSAYLAMTSTLTGLVFGIAAQGANATPALLLATPLVLLALRRLAVTAREWSYPDVRARAVATVAAR